ncbi:hypothetical protein [Cellulomonas sp. KRMCY2]|uniref:hypothetical protein n=1 Tax=Cellulomonas sp. KRMCY2 TaxID=1304865 RepID=UPI0004BCD0AB|nr:hypothetical protein [Cellulomonas sp. KRMCY2]
MDRPVVRQSPDEHWAPDHVVLARHVLNFAGRLFVERDADGEVLTHSPLAGMAAVEQRYPAWALGPFGRIETEHPLPEAPGVFALVQQGVVRYVGASRNLSRTFGPRHGIGHITRRDCQLSRREERCRLNRLVVAEARAGRVVDLYLLVTGPSGVRALLSGRSPGEAPAEIARQVAEVARGTWHLPS